MLKEPLSLIFSQKKDNIIAFKTRDSNQPLNYRMENKKDDKKTADIFLYDMIGGWGITAQRFGQDLKALGDVKTINLRINSDGGDVFDGRAIYTLLAQHPARVISHVDGLAASIASLIMLAGNEVRMADGSFIMIHNAWGMGIGDANEMRRLADLLDSVTASITDTYIARTKGDRKEIENWMNDETWMTASEAKDRGFCDVVTEPLKVAAQLRDPSLFKKPPANLLPNKISALQNIKLGKDLIASPKLAL